MREGGEDDGKGMVHDIEGVRSLGERNIQIRKGCDLGWYGGGGGCDFGVDGSDGGDVAHGSGENSDVGDGGESVVYRSGGDGGSVVHRSVGGRLYRSGCYFYIGWGFRCAGGGGSGTGGGVCREACCEAGSVVFKWEGIFFV